MVTQNYVVRKFRNQLGIKQKSILLLKMKIGEKYIGKVEKNIWGGMGFLKNKDITVFVKGGIEGQEIEYKIIKKKKNFCEAEIVSLIKHSEIEILKSEQKNAIPGCTYQNIKYEEQLRIKKSQLQEIFRNHLTVKIFDVLPSPEIFGYRNKIEFSCGYENISSKIENGKKIFLDSGFALGFHPPKSWAEVISIDDVFIASNSVQILRREIEKIIKEFIKKNGIKDYNYRKFSPWNPLIHKGFWRGVIFRESRKNSEILINFVVSRAENSTFWEYFIEKVLDIPLPNNQKISGILQTIHTGKSDAIVSPKVSVLWGKEVLEEQLGDNIFEISPFSFFQTNTKGAEVLYTTIQNFLGDTTNSNILDLFCGTGSIGIFCSSKAQKIVGIELVEEAVEKARKNARKNGITNAEFYAGKVEKLLPEILQKNVFDTVIIDPPRSGMHPKALQYICNLPVKKLIYVSCNPSTLERDVKLLHQARGWELTYVQGVDMFPHTPHLEVVSVLER